MFGFYASDYYRGKIEDILLKSLDRKFHMPKYRKSVVRVFTDLLHSIQETVNNEFYYLFFDGRGICCTVSAQKVFQNCTLFLL